MKRLSKCTQFQLKSMMTSTLYFLLIYSAIYAALVLMLINLVKHIDASGGNFNAGFYFAGAVFAFILIAASYKSNFNFLLMFGNTRKNIFFSSASAIVVISVAFSALSILFDQFDILLAKKILSDFNILSNQNILNILIYKTDVNMATSYLWYASLFIMICFFGLLYGALTYKLGKGFIIAFWVGFGLLLTVGPIITGINDGTVLLNALTAYLCIGVPYGILLAPVNFIITAVIFGAAAYLISSSQPQAA